MVGSVGYCVEYGPTGERKRFEGKLGEIWPEYRRLIAEGLENVQIKTPDGETADPHQFELNVVRGGVSVREHRSRSAG